MKKLNKCMVFILILLTVSCGKEESSQSTENKSKPKQPTKTDKKYQQVQQNLDLSVPIASQAVRVSSSETWDILTIAKNGNWALNGKSLSEKILPSLDIEKEKNSHGQIIGNLLIIAEKYISYKSLYGVINQCNSKKIHRIHIGANLPESGKTSLGALACFIESKPLKKGLTMQVEFLGKTAKDIEVGGYRCENWQQNPQQLEQVAQTMAKKDNSVIFHIKQVYPSAFKDLPKILSILDGKDEKKVNIVVDAPVIIRLVQNDQKQTTIRVGCLKKISQQDVEFLIGGLSFSGAEKYDKLKKILHQIFFAVDQFSIHIELQTNIQLQQLIATLDTIHSIHRLRKNNVTLILDIIDKW